jgi:hypothetical protein
MMKEGEIKRIIINPEEIVELKIGMAMEDGTMIEINKKMIGLLQKDYLTIKGNKLD